MAPKAEKKPAAQPAKKAVAKKSTAGRKKGSKKAVESYKIYIYKVAIAAFHECSVGVCWRTRHFAVLTSDQTAILILSFLHRS